MANGESSLELPVGRYTVVAEHGLEYERGEHTLEVTEEGPTVLNLQLRRWVHMSDLGWWSGDMHVHRSLRTRLHLLWPRMGPAWVRQKPA